MHVSSREKNTGLSSRWAFRNPGCPRLESDPVGSEAFSGIPDGYPEIHWSNWLGNPPISGWFHAAGHTDGLKGTYHWLLVDPLALYVSYIFDGEASMNPPRFFHPQSRWFLIAGRSLFLKGPRLCAKPRSLAGCGRMGLKGGEILVN